MLFGVSFLAFYPRYLSQLATLLPWYMHAHYVLIITWMGFLFVQPLMIRKQMYSLHRALGKASYFLLPLVVISSFFMIRFGYHRIIAELQLSGTLTPDEVTHHARATIALGFYSFFILLLFYPLAIYYKKYPIIHGRYMVVAALSLVGPVVDRVTYQLVELLGGPSYPWEGVSFLIIDFLLLGLLYTDNKNGYSLKPGILSLLVIVGGQVAYIFLRDSWLWQGFVGLVL